MNSRPALTFITYQAQGQPGLQETLPQSKQRASILLYLSAIHSLLTYYGLDVVLHHDDELIINPNSHITQNLSVFCKIKIVQAVLILLWAVILHEFLKTI